MSGRTLLPAVLLVALLAVVGCSAPVAGGTSSSTGQTASRHAVTTTPAAPPTGSNAAVSADTEAAPTGENITVLRVVDGDTVELADGRRVRLLGIDSCEGDAPGGQQATNAAESLIAAGEPITMTVEPGAPDTDRYGRLLRYVQLGDGRDFGVEMVKDDHTGIYDPAHNDASRAYLDQLYAADLERANNPPAGRDCGEPEPAAEPAPAPAAKRAPAAAGDDDDSRGTGAAYYPNCKAAKAAGAAPLHRGEPGYRSKLDRDDDGVACE